MSDPRRPMDDLRGASRLAVDATRSVTDVVEDMHGAIGGIAAVFAAPVYASIRAVTGAVGVALDAALLRLPPPPAGWAPRWVRRCWGSPRCSASVRRPPSARRCWR